MIGSESDWQDGGLWTLIILDFHTGGFCDLRIYLLALGFAGLPQVESIIRGFATTTRQRAPVTLLSSLPWASLLLSCDVAPSAVMRDLLNSALSGWSGRRDSNPRPSAPKADALPGYATPRFSDCIAISVSQACRASHSRNQRMRKIGARKMALSVPAISSRKTQSRQVCRRCCSRWRTISA